MVRTALNGIGRVSPVVLPSAMTLIGAFLLSTAASAQTAAIATNKGTGMEKVDSQAAPPPTGLTGDWGGLRTDLHDSGIDAAASYVSETAGNYQGGSRQIARETGQFALGFTADMAALAGLDGGTMQFTLTDRRGEDLGAAANLGVLQQVQEVYGRGQTERVTQLWYEQKFDQDTWALKLGRATVGEDFDNFPCYFMNLSFCGSAPGNLAGSYWYNWPVSQWTGRLRYNDDNHYVQAAVYEANPRNLENSFSFGHFSGATGVLVPVEIGWDPDPTATSGIGIYKIGGWYSNAPGDDLLLDINGKPRVLTGAPALLRHDRYGFWFSMQQQIFGEAANGKFLSGGAIFFNATVTDHRTSAIDDQLAAGFWWKGIIPALPDDVLGIGVARTHVNSLVAYGDSLAGALSLPDAEYATEIYYSLHPFDWIEMRPNFQLVHNPGGIKSAQDVGVLGLKAAVTL
jgi:porin